MVCTPQLHVNMNDSKKPNVANSKKKNARESKILSEIKKKKECERKAFNVVLELIDGGLEEDVLLSKLGSINASHYEDVVEERFILKQCGYVICDQILTSIPTQQYKISLVQKKVYDITERKKFCSNICYKSSKYLQSQLLTSPLWLRDSEKTPTFQLLKKDVNPDVSVLNGSNQKSQAETLSNCSSTEGLEEKISTLKI